LLDWQVKRLISRRQESEIVNGLKKLPGLINEALLQETQIKQLAKSFINKNSALFLGRGTMYAIAMEGALKTKRN
jgi:glucosamine--fructose-6-phosphate aminotransferase (isomerizing)